MIFIFLTGRVKKTAEELLRQLSLPLHHIWLQIGVTSWGRAEPSRHSSNVFTHPCPDKSLVYHNYVAVCLFIPCISSKWRCQLVKVSPPDMKERLDDRWTLHYALQFSTCFSEGGGCHLKTWRGGGKNESWTRNGWISRSFILVPWYTVSPEGTSGTICDKSTITWYLPRFHLASCSSLLLQYLPFVITTHN